MFLETAFDMDKFFDEVPAIYKKIGKVIVAVSEGMKDASGEYISEYGSDLLFAFELNSCDFVMKSEICEKKMPL